MNQAHLSALLAEWREAERDLAVVRDVSLDEAAARARRAREAYAQAVRQRPPAPARENSHAPSATLEDDATWGLEPEWAP